jgi:hypothetical protein
MSFFIFTMIGIGLFITVINYMNSEIENESIRLSQSGIKHTVVKTWYGNYIKMEKL